mgnify:CR=1 FL=1
MKALGIVMLITAGLGLLKGLFMLLWPSHAQKLVDWWLAAPRTAVRAAGLLTGALGVILIWLGIAAIREPLVATAILLGGLLVAAGGAYQHTTAWQAMARPFATGGRILLLRLVAVGVLLVTAVLLILCVKALRP